MIYYCEQCGEDFEEGDEVVKTCFNHSIIYGYIKDCKHIGKENLAVSLKERIEAYVICVILPILFVICVFIIHK